MKLKPILTALAVAIAVIAQPALADFQFTQNEKGEVTHYNGIPLPPIQTVEEARAQAQKEVAPAKKAREAEQAEQPANPPQEVFFTGKPYLEETGQYLFLFRHYDPELARWTTSDPSGFPDGANNVAYMPVPTFAIDWQGLEVKLVFTVNSGTLTAEDLQTGQKLSISGVLSGNGASTNKAQDDWKVKRRSHSPRKLVGRPATGQWMVSALRTEWAGRIQL